MFTPMKLVVVFISFISKHDFYEMFHKNYSQAEAELYM